jgi:IclR family acetate operon transcriptional repressor
MNPLHCTGLGKAILAFYPQDQVEAVISKGLPAKTQFTLTSPEMLRTELDQIRVVGFAIDDQENELGVRCTGAPIFDYTGKVVGAISVSGPASRISRDRCLELGEIISEAAQVVSRRMGFRVQEKRSSLSSGELLQSIQEKKQ